MPQEYLLSFAFGRGDEAGEVFFGVCDGLHALSVSECFLRLSNGDFLRRIPGSFCLLRMERGRRVSAHFPPIRVDLPLSSRGGFAVPLRLCYG